MSASRNTTDAAWASTYIDVPMTAVQAPRRPRELERAFDWEKALSPTTKSICDNPQTSEVVTAVAPSQGKLSRLSGTGEEPRYAVVTSAPSSCTVA